ncbi:RNA polymerase-associated protein RapA [Aquisphaera giovannonii]|uniref:RNA polymerase-associated protein RapA n=1 Tax=Aquisphaera giovannonii TaxID=406548 RepID=A0A5B9W4Y6_9BACT|nr:DEAD/DEAH box helicase [Aquisphaera giovannonii]QEH35766.1 RNA polymerase-associated protein RapA [Aquisphaera giovannonii]
MLSADLQDHASRRTRELGCDDFLSRKVTVVDGDAWHVDATVRGSRPYEVSLSREGDAIEAWCSCPYCEDDLEVCKHIWAALLAADGEGHLRGDGRQRARGLKLAAPDVEDIFEDEDWGEPPGPAPRPRPRARRARSKSRPGQPRRAAQAWKQALSRLRSPRDRAPAIRQATLAPGHEIVYVADVPASLAGGGLVLEVATRRRKKDGEWSKPSGRRFGLGEIAQLPDPDDRQALSILAGGREQVNSYYTSYGYYDSAPSRFLLPHALSEALLPRLCATGRCLLRESEAEPSMRPLRWDDAGPWEFWLKAAPDGAGKAYAIAGELRRGEERLPLRAPHLLLSGGLVFWEDRVAPLRDFDAFPWITMLRQQGGVRVPAGQEQEFLEELLRMPDLPRLDLPEDLHYEEVTPAPRPCLTIKRRDDRGRMSDRDPSWVVGELSFDYGGHVVPARSPARSVFEPEARRLLLRDPAAERSFDARLEEVGFHRRIDYYRQGEALEMPARNLPKAAAALLKEGWRVEAEGKLYRQAGDFRIEVTSGIDWFELHGGVTFGDQEVPLPALLAALRRGEDLVPLGDGSFGLLPEEWLKKYAPLAGLGTPEGDHLQFRRTQVGLLDALLAEQPEARFDERFERARERLRQFQGVAPADPPEGFRGELRGYQRDGLGWLHFLREFGFGGCLADDMGLGKTVQVLALLEARRELRAARRKGRRPPPSLVVAPRSLIFNWKEEAARFAPELRVLDHTGIGRGKPGGGFDDCDVVLTTYGTLRRDIVDLKDYAFDYAILDEAQAIKNASSLSAKAARLIRAEHRLALSGTPVENHLGELWSLFEFLNPGMLGQAAELGKAGLGLRKADEEARSLLARALRPFLLRRTKAQVAKDLPEKSEQTIYCDLEPAQRKLYDELREHYRSSLLGLVARDGIKKSKIQILEALLRLRQAACHPGLIDKAGRSGESSAKLDVLVPQLREVFDEGHKTLVFSQFTSLLAIVKQRLDEEKIPYTYLDGRTRDRQARVQQFQEDPDCKVFLISLKAGGLGLNLTAADYIFLLDPWWNPAVESQAIDRAHRIGQTRPVFAYRLIAKDTVEDKVLQLQAQKRALADAIITADNSLIRDLGREDLELLLS